MGKHTTSKSLGNLTNDVSENPTQPDGDSLSEKVQHLERRVTVLEGLLNDVMHQIDKPVRDQKFGNPEKGNRFPKGNPKTPVSKATEPKTKTKLEKSPQSKGSTKAIEACASRILKFLSDGKSVRHRDMSKEMPNHTFSPKTVRRAIHSLKEAKKVILTPETLEGEKVYFVSIAK